MFLFATNVLTIFVTVICTSKAYTVPDPADRFGQNTQPEFLLPRTSEPIHYDLDVMVHLGPKFEYNGTVAIDIYVTNDTAALHLHSIDLNIDLDRSYVQSEDQQIRIVGTSIVTSYEFLQLDIDKVLLRGGFYKLVLAFSGNYYSIKSGLFLEKYEPSEGDIRYLIATHFEPARARRMFPCYDEPSWRTSFDVRITHRNDYNAVSNAPIAAIQTYNENYMTTIFQRTANMSTYLLAIGVSDFKTLIKTDKFNRTYQLLTQPNLVNQSDDGLSITLKTVENLEKKTKVKYFLPKLDGIAVPRFGGGMENWGLIVYDPSVSKDFLNTTNSKGTTELITHEVSHQWFGDLVTLAWWDWVWLNEGFATYYAALIGDMILPEKRFVYHLVNRIQTMLNEDSYNQTWALNAPVDTLLEISGKFDSVSYTKGAAILRFMSLIFPNYDQSITHYLETHSQGVVMPKDLLKSIKKYNNNLPFGATVESVMDSWLNKPGFPLVTLNTTRLEHGVIMVISQEKFNYNNKSDDKWWIPIFYTTEDQPNFEITRPKIWLRDSEETIVTYVQNYTGWIILNIQQAVFCRVNYDAENWNNIISYLKKPAFEKIHVLNRAQLVDDALNLAEYGQLEHELVLDLLEYLEQEKDELPHKSAERGLVRFGRFLEGTDIYVKFIKFVTKIFGEEKTKRLFKPLNLAVMAKNTLNLMSERHANPIEEFNYIADQIFSESQYDIVKNAVQMHTRTSTAPPEVHYKFLEKLQHRTVHNLQSKTKFLKYDYTKVEKWLNAKY